MAPRSNEQPGEGTCGALGLPAFQWPLQVVGKAFSGLAPCSFCITSFQTLSVSFPEYGYLCGSNLRSRLGLTEKLD